LHDPACMERFLLGVTTNSTPMFREPDFYTVFREQIVPLLRTYPFIRIWHVGCGTGEEVYAMAILLYESGLYDRCRIYATDINDCVLRQAKAGVFTLDAMKEYGDLYLKAGGQQLLSDYYTTEHGSAILRPFLKENLVFSTHNLVTDASFNEFNVILCQNVLIYFNQWLQDRVHNLLYESLRIFGILSLGKQETLSNSPHEQDYEVLSAQTKLYRRII
jgi:chemotaxis protein methyltransferase CheR